MVDELVSIEVDGKPIKARKGAMLIEVTDAENIYVPRFCYHKKLSIAANCRMCLVDVEKAPKPLPACATPIMEGMKVRTQSAKAKDAQKATMEFLLINHPLDCPICDQGGECELQDLAMGYGSDVSRYTDRKRVVQDKNIGSLVQTDLTRCIHCTRCVRFGDEIAGMRELGATGRGEHMQIGTYIEQAMTSEMSGNVIDLCPVGALTSKPYRYSARAWELRQAESIAPHDAVGSNIYLHYKGKTIKRVVPRENDSLNEVWVSDRDRFSYEGLYSDDRLLQPRVKINGNWVTCDWETALNFSAQGLQKVISESGPASLGVLASPTATLEELYLLQKIARGLGCNNLDHRLRQTDFSKDGESAYSPYLPMSLKELDQCDTFFIVGSNSRKEQPLINHRIRKATMRGAKTIVLNSIDYDLNFKVAHKVISQPCQIINELAAIARALADTVSHDLDDSVLLVMSAQAISDHHRQIAETLAATENGVLLIGNDATQSPQYSSIVELASLIATLTGMKLGIVAESSNSVGAWMTGFLPFVDGQGQLIPTPGLNAQQMLSQSLKAYVLHNIEPEFDTSCPALSINSLQDSGFVVALTAYTSENLDHYADVLLPIALFAETSGTYVNASGYSQSFNGAVLPVGEARPAWKVYRVLGNLLKLAGFDYESSYDVLTQINQNTRNPAYLRQPSFNELPALFDERQDLSLDLLVQVPTNRCDSLVRRAQALQKTLDVGDDCVRMNSKTALQLGLNNQQQCTLVFSGQSVSLGLIVDDHVAEDCVAIYAARESSARISQYTSRVSVKQ